MTARRRATDRGFTVIMCTQCRADRGLPIVEELRDSIRRSRHGILVNAPCLLGKLTCAARTDGPGSMVVLQPCTDNRSPLGPPRWIGPITNLADLAALRDWLDRGEWNIGTLPQHLRSPLNWLAAASRRN